MFVLRTFRYRIYPTRRQRDAFELQRRFACDLYNAALEQRRDAHRRWTHAVSYSDQSAELTELRHAAELEAPEGMNFWCQQEVLRRLDRAFAAFFHRLRNGNTPGYPRFKPAGRFDTLCWSFAGNAGGVGISERNRLRLQGIGHIKVKWHRPLPKGSALREVRVTRKGYGKDARYYAGFALRLPDPIPRFGGDAVGIDVGVRALATLSTGEHVHGPRAARGNAPRVRRAARRAARRRRGSHRRRKAVALLGRHREREANRRRDAAHKLSRQLADRFWLIAVEDLRIKNMLRSAKGVAAELGTNVAQKRGLNRELADQGWGMLFTFLAYKAEEAGGRVIKVPPRGTSRTCSRCGHEDARSRRAERFCCIACNYRADADVNAANIILARSLQLLAADELRSRIRPGRGHQAKTAALATVA